MNVTESFHSSSFDFMTTPHQLFDNSTTGVDQGRNGSFGRASSSFGGFSLSPSQVFFRYSPIMSVSLLGVFLNLIALILLVKVTHSSKVTTNIFLTSQLVFDLGSSASSVSMALGEAFKPTIFSESIAMQIVCKVWYSRFIILSFTNMSILNCTLLTLERYFKIVFPLRHKIHMTEKVAKLVVGGTYVFNILNTGFMFLITMTVTNRKCERDTSFSPTFYHVTRIYNNVIMTGIPMGVIFICYTHMLIVLHRRMKKFKVKETSTNKFQPKLAIETSATGNSLNTEFSSVTSVSVPVASSPVRTKGPSGGNHNSNTDKNLGNKDHCPTLPKTTKHEKSLLKAEKNLLKVALLVSISFIVCNVPVRLYYLLSVFGLYETTHGVAYLVIATLVYLDFALHPIIYALTLKPLKDKLKTLCNRHR